MDMYDDRGNPPADFFRAWGGEDPILRETEEDEWYEEEFDAGSVYENEIVLCAASAYSKKFYLNEDFSVLPERVKQELQILCVLFVEDVGGIIRLVFDEEGQLLIRTEADEEDILYDEIGSGLLVHKMQREQKELFESLEMFFRVFFYGETEGLEYDFGD